MKKQQALRWIPYLLILLFALYALKEAKGNGDFKIFLEAARMISQGESPYKLWIFVSEGNTGLYYYSPLFATLLIPLSLLPQFFANLCWLFFNVFLLYRSWILLRRYLPLSKLNAKQLAWILGLTIALDIRFILYNFDMIQMTIFLMWGALEAIALFEQKKVVWGGLVLALVINVKVLPIVLLPYLIYRRAWLGSLSTIVCFMLLLYLPAVFIGWSFNQELLAAWWEVINPSNAEHLIESNLGVHSITALIPPLLTPTEGALPIERHLLNLGPDTAIFVTNLFRLVLVGLTLYFLRWPPFRSTKNKLLMLRELGYLFLLIPLIFPHQQKYAFYLMIPALVYLSYVIVTNYKKEERGLSGLQWRGLLILMVLFFALTTLTTDGVVGRDLNKITQHFKLITIGALCLIPALMITDPRMSSKE